MRQRVYLFEANAKIIASDYDDALRQLAEHFEDVLENNAELGEIAESGYMTLCDAVT